MPTIPDKAELSYEPAPPAADSDQSVLVEEQDQWLEQRKIIALHRAITSRNVASLNSFLKNTPQVDLAQPLKGSTPLSLAIYLQAVDMIKVRV